MDQTLAAVLSYLPPSPVSTTASLSAATTASSGDDHISRLSDALLSNIISRLPTKDAARTTMLSSRFRRLWASTPLHLDDAHLHPDAITGALSAHPGPFRSVRLTSTHLASLEPAVSSWFASLAAKNVQELVLVSHPWPIDWLLPSNLLRCASLRRLYLALCQFPDASCLPPAFVHLRELGIVHSSLRDRDLDAVLARCAELESLSLVLTHDDPMYVHLRSGSLKCVALWMSMVREVHLDDAPSLERLVLEPAAKAPKHVKIFNAPRLEVLGYFDVGLHQLKVGATVMKVGVKVSSSAMVRSLKILALRVRFSVEEQAKMVAVLLRCFPCLETLHVTSIHAELRVNADVGFWYQIGYVECVQSHLKKVVLEAVRGECSELAFVKFIMERAQMLEEMRVLVADGCSRDMVLSRLSSEELPSADARVVVERRHVSHAWGFHRASDMLRSDPFDC